MRWDVIIPILIYLIAMLAVGGYLHGYLKDRRVSFQEQFFIGGRSLGPLV